MNILFTCVGRRVALVRAFRSAMEKLGLEGGIFATDITDTSPAFHVVDKGVLVPPAGDRRYIPALLEVVRKRKVGLLVPLTDVDLMALAQNRDKFEARNCQVMVASEDSLITCMDKSRTNALIARAGLQTIYTRTLSLFRHKPFYPCFIKPIRGSAGIGTAVIRDAKHLATHLSVFGDQMMVQEYIPGQEFTIDVYRTRAGEVKCVVPRQRLVVRGGEVEKGMTVKDAGLIDATLRLCGELGDMWGVFCCQCRRSFEGAAPRFFEINPRFGGGAPLSIAAGANLPLYLLQEVTGQPVRARLGRFTDRLLMLRYDDSVFIPGNKVTALTGAQTPLFH